jgi:hypothetical protein
MTTLRRSILIIINMVMAHKHLILTTTEVANSNSHPMVGMITQDMGSNSSHLIKTSILSSSSSSSHHSTITSLRTMATRIKEQVLDETCSRMMFKLTLELTNNLSRSPTHTAAPSSSKLAQLVPLTVVDLINTIRLRSKRHLRIAKLQAPRQLNFPLLLAS